MDKYEAAWNCAQIRRAEWAVIDVAYHLLAPAQRKPLQNMHARLTREKDAAIAAYRDAMEGRDEPQDVEGEPDGYDTCSWGDSRGCGGVEWIPLAVLRNDKDMACPKCRALSECDAEDERPRSRQDEGCL